jgi:hypothetical protein
MKFGKTTLILRIFDEVKAKEFYVDFLSFKIDWEHRFEPGLPLYMQISKDSCILHLSEHHGDASPGAAMRIETKELEAFQKQLCGKGIQVHGAGNRRNALGQLGHVGTRPVWQQFDVY